MDWISWFTVAPFRKFALAVGALCREGTSFKKGDLSMAKNGDLKACLANLRELQARSDIEPEQKTAIEVMMGRIRKLARLQNPTRRDVSAAYGK